MCNELVQHFESITINIIFCIWPESSSSFSWLVYFCAWATCVCGKAINIHVDPYLDYYSKSKNPVCHHSFREKYSNCNSFLRGCRYFLMRLWMCMKCSDTSIRNYYFQLGQLFLSDHGLVHGSEKFNQLELAQKFHADRDWCQMHAHQFWWM